MLRYKGHTFADSAHCSCCVGDARKSLIDPTFTGKTRQRFRVEMGLRWRKLRVLTREILTKQDLLRLKAGGLMNTIEPGIVQASSKVEAFRRWFDMGLDSIVAGNGAWMQPLLASAYAQGTSYGQQMTNQTVTHTNMRHRSGLMQTLALSELRGIAAVVSQQAVRAVSNGLLLGHTPMRITRDVWKIIDKIGINRTRAMIELCCVRCHAEATLDIYEAAGVTSVGLIPESVQAAKPTNDALTLDAKRKAAKKTSAKKTGGNRKAKTKTRSRAGGGPGSRTKNPSPRTIQRIRRAELELAKRVGERVYVRTAGDDNVCQRCEDIAEGGPYTLAMARSLIPAHPHCRCVFVPAGDKRFARDAEFDHEAYA